MISQVLSYFKFITKSNNEHGVHSPFIFNLVTQCLYTKTDRDNKFKHDKYRRSLLENKKIIEVTDFGKGSKVFKSNKRQISKIAKVAGISKIKSNLLLRLVQYFKPSNILEIGTSLGIGTAALSIPDSNSKITTLEGCPETHKIAKNTLSKFELKNIEFITGDFQETLPNVIENNVYDLIYFDGNHQKKPTLDYFNQCLKSIHNDSVFIFDDIHWSKEMEEAWELIKKHDKVTVTIDIYFWGIVFFRKEQVKEHFKIRVFR